MHKTDKRTVNWRSFMPVMALGRILVGMLAYAAGPLRGAGPEIRLERTLREYQGRYHYAHNAYLTWPDNGSQVAPHFPPDGFYGDIAEKPELGVRVVEMLASQFCGDQLYLAYVKIDGQGGAPDGNIENLQEVPMYTSTDFPASLGPTTRDNYLTQLHSVEQWIRNLKYVPVSCITAGPDGLATLVQVRSGSGGGTNLVQAQASADALWGSSNWADLPEGWSGMGGLWDSQTPPPLGLYEHTTYSQTLQWGAQEDAVRGRVYCDLQAPPYWGGTGTLYLTYTNEGYQTAAPPPPVPADAKFHVYGAEATGGQLNNWGAFGDSKPEWSSAAPITRLWKLIRHVVIFKPAFRTRPDEVGCGCGEECGFGSATVKLGSAFVMLNLGRVGYGRHAGYILLKVEQPIPNVGVLNYLRPAVAPAEVTVSSGGDTFLDEVDTTEGKVVVQRNAGDQYAFTLACFAPNQPSPFRTVQVINPGQNVNTIQVTETTTLGGGVDTKVSTFTWDWNARRWGLALGGGLRNEFLTIPPYDQTRVRVEQRTVKGPSGQAVVDEQRTYKLYDWGEELIELVVDPAGAKLRTAWDYYSDVASTHTNYGRLKCMVDWTGYWERYVQYDGVGRLTWKVWPFLDNTTNTAEDLNRELLLDYTPTAGSPTIQRVEKLKGNVISKRITVYGPNPDETTRLVTEHTCQVTTGTVASTDNLKVVTKSYCTGDYTLDSLPISVQRPDGTMDFYSYPPTANGRATQKDTGEPDGAGGIRNGLRTRTEVNPAGRVLSETVEGLKTTQQTLVPVLLERRTYSDPDEVGRLRVVTFLDNTYERTEYGCCGITSFRDRDGAMTTYGLDALGRQTTATKNGITTETAWDADNKVLATYRYPSAAPTQRVVLDQQRYNLAGRVTERTNGLVGITTYDQALVPATGHLIKTNTYPPDAAGARGTRIEDYYRDRSLQSVTGTAAQPVRYAYDGAVDDTIAGDTSKWRPWTKELRLQAAADTDSPEWTKVYYDLVGRAYRTVYADATPSDETDNPWAQTTYNNSGQLEKLRDPDGVLTLYKYDPQGRREYTILDVNRDASLDPADFGPSQDRVTREVTDYLAHDEAGNARQVDLRRTTTYVWPTLDQDTALTVQTAEESADGLTSWQTTWNGSQPYTSTTKRTLPDANGYRTTTVTNFDNSLTVSQYQYGRLLSVTRSTAAGQVARTTYGYNEHGLLNTVTDARNGATLRTYNGADLLWTLTTPAPGTGQPAQTTTYAYAPNLQLATVSYPDSASANYDYYTNGLVKRTWGARTYPVGYDYDAQGRLTKMTNWGSYNPAGGSTGPRVTTWAYHPNRGWLASKQYDTGGPVTYTNTPGARLAMRTWARGANTTYAYNNAGDLGTVSYNDGSPGLTYSYDRRGRLTNVVQGAGGNALTRIATYSDAGQLTSESFSTGQLSGLAVASAYDGVGPRVALSLTVPGVATLTNGFLYDGASRLTNVTDGACAAGYAYLANSPLVGQITLKQGANVRMTTTRLYDYLNRLQQTVSVPAATNQLAWRWGYALNNANQRTRAALADGSFWVYEYDALGQVTSGKRYWADGTPVAGQQFEYAFDDIGNRAATKAGGDQTGMSLRSAAYTNNTLNQITGRGVPGAVDVIGIATPAAAVTVNSSNVGIYRRNDYFRKELAVSNGSGPVWQSVAVSAQNGTTNTTWPTGNLLVPPAGQTFQYDADGNLTNDLVWVYSWDAENRLVQMTNTTALPTAARKKLVFSYDDRGRRIRKTVYPWGASDYSATPALDLKFIYDDSNLLAELNGTNNAIVRAYVWGLDLSGSQQGAGGVGGLLVVKPTGQNPQFPAYDGNGDVVGLVDATSGAATGQYEYGPFAESVRTSGASAAANPFRFSTKYTDVETDLLYYGYRYYGPSCGRWLSRDPLEDRRGEANLYAFVMNNAQGLLDPSGLTTYDARKFYGLYGVAGFRKGDTIITDAVTIQAQSNNLWPFASGTKLAKAQCLLERLGFALPPPRNGFHSATFSDRIGHGYTVIWTPGFYRSKNAASFVDVPDIENFDHCSGTQVLLVTLWHELKGHNQDFGDDGPAFDARYEGPVSKAWKSAVDLKQTGCCWRNNRQFRTTLQSYCCLCGIRF